MKAMITCGYPYSGYDIVGQFLYQSGVVKANISRNEKLSPVEIEDKIFRLYELDKEKITTQAELGLICQEFAKNLFLENISEKSWGWDSSNSLWLVDFWKKFDPQIRFILVYASPEFIIANILQQQTTSYTLEKILQRINAYNTEIIRFYNQYPDYCCLVNTQAISKNPSHFIEIISSQFKLDLNIKNIEFNSTLPSSILVHLAQNLLIEIDENSDQEKENIIPITKAMSLSINHALAKSLINEADILYQELESISNIPYAEEKSSTQEKVAAFKEYSTLILTLDETQKNNKNLQKKVIELNNKTLLLSDNSKLKESKVNELQNKIQKLKKEYQENITKQTAENKQNLEQENELLLLQLDQVQQELKSYFSKYKEKEQNNHHLKNKLNVIEQERETLREKIKNLEKVHNMLALTLNKTEEETSKLDQKEQNIKKLNEKIKTLKIEYEKNILKQKTENEQELEENNALLLLQLNQVQEELKSYFIKYKEKEKETDDLQQKIRQLIKPIELLSFNIDLKKPCFNGDNWYNIEDNGRWAGPGLKSTIPIPTLLKGIYEINFYIMDAMSLDIPKNINISLNNIELPEIKPRSKRFTFKKQEKVIAYPIPIKCIFNTEDFNNEEPWILSITTSGVISPADVSENKEDLRKLSIKIKSIQVVNQQLL